MTENVSEQLPEPAVQASDQTTTSERFWRGLLKRPELGALTALCLLLALFTILRPANFSTAENLQAVARDASILLILAVAITFTTVMGVFDLSIGSVLVFSQMVAVKVMGDIGGDSLGVCLVGVVAALVSGGAWGLLNGWLVSHLDLSPFIVTLATLGAALGAAQLVGHGSDLTSVPPGLTRFFGVDLLLGVPNLTWVALAVAAVGGVVLSRTKFGRITYAIGSNAQAAIRAGINVKRHMLAVYVLVGVLVGLAGFLDAARFGTTSLGGHADAPLEAITAVALGGASLFGGVGSVGGSVIGVGIPAVLQNGLLILGTEVSWYQILVGAALVASIYLDKRRRALQRRG